MGRVEDQSVPKISDDVGHRLEADRHAHAGEAGAVYLHAVIDAVVVIEFAVNAGFLTVSRRIVSGGGSEGGHGQLVTPVVITFTNDGRRTRRGIASCHSRGDYASGHFAFCFFLFLCPISHCTVPSSGGRYLPEEESTGM